MESIYINDNNAVIYGALMQEDIEDICCFDQNNDQDNDGVCGDVDVCPNDQNNDIDGDGICDCNIDNINNCSGEIDECPNDPNNNFPDCLDVNLCSEEGSCNYVLSFDGIDDYVDFGDNYNNLNLPITFEYKAKFHDNGGSFSVLTQI